MNTFQKIKEIYEIIGWDYYGWNNPNRQLPKEIGAYFVDRNDKTHSLKSHPTKFMGQIVMMESVHISPQNSPDWDFIIRMINLVDFPISLLGLAPYNRYKAIEEIYDFMQ